VPNAHIVRACFGRAAIESVPPSPCGCHPRTLPLAVATARQVQETAAKKILKLAGQQLAAGRREATLRTLPCCTPGANGPPGGGHPLAEQTTG